MNIELNKKDINWLLDSIDENIDVLDVNRDMCGGEEEYKSYTEDIEYLIDLYNRLAELLKGE